MSLNDNTPQSQRVELDFNNELAAFTLAAVTLTDGSGVYFLMPNNDENGTRYFDHNNINILFFYKHLSQLLHVNEIELDTLIDKVKFHEAKSAPEPLQAIVHQLLKNVTKKKV